SDDRITLTVADVPPLGQQSLLAHQRAQRPVHPAIAPPPHSMPTLTPGASTERVTAAEHRALASRETVTDMPDPTSARPDSGHGAHDIVDAIPRATSIPPERTSTTTATPVPHDRLSAASLSELYALSDFSGALELAERRLEANPNDAEAQRYV